MTLTLYKLTTGLRLATRFRSQIVAAAMIVSVIATGVVILSGLSRGEVQRLLDRLVQSPTARLVQGWVVQDRAGITRTLEVELLQEIKELALIIPDVTKTATAENPQTGSSCGITLLGTRPGDPHLRFYDIEPPSPGERAIILSRYAAEVLGIECDESSGRRSVVLPDQKATLRITRGGGETEGALLTVKVCGVVDTARQKQLTGYLDCDVIDAIESYHNGFPVPAFGWSGSPRPVPVSYEAYIAYTKSPLSSMDHTRLGSHGLQADELRAEHQFFRSFAGLIDVSGLRVYRINATGSSDDRPLQLSIAPDDIERITDADEVILPWCTPREIVAADSAITVIGCSGRLRWLKHRFADAEACYPLNSPELLVHFIRDGRLNDAPAKLTIGCGDAEIVLHRSSVSSPSPTEGTFFGPPDASETDRCDSDGSLALLGSSPPAKKFAIASVPAALLAHLDLVDRREACWDASMQMFVMPSRECVYYKARFYPHRVEDVPILAAELERRGFTTQSERTRVEEIAGYHATLQLITWIVEAVSVLASLAALIVLLHDETDRMRGSIGVMRIIGVKRSDIFLFMIIRALVIGLLGACLTVFMGYAVAHLIDRYVAPCVVVPGDLTLITAGCLASCILGVIWPAWDASRTDPVRVLIDSHVR